MSAQNSQQTQSRQTYDIESNSDTTTADSADSDDEVEELSLDLIFEVLKNRRRRDVIRFLQDQDGRTSLGDLAEHVAALENDTTTQALTSSQRKRVYVGLYQCHLPKMDDMDIVAFNQDRGFVELGPNVELLEPYLDTTTEEGNGWHQYYLGVSVVGVLAVLATALVSATGTLTVGVMAVVVSLFLGTSIYHTLSTKSAD